MALLAAFLSARDNSVATASPLGGGRCVQCASANPPQARRKARIGGARNMKNPVLACALLGATSCALAIVKSVQHLQRSAQKEPE